MPEQDKKGLRSFLFENTTVRQTVVKNTFWLSVSNFGGRLIKAIIIIYAARVLGTAGYGVFSYAVTLAGFLTIFMDPGVNTVLMRDASRSSDEDRQILFSTTFILKIILLIIGVAVIIFIAPFFTTLPGAQALLPIVAFILMFDTLREFFLSLLRSREKMEWDAGVTILTNLAIVAFGFAFIFLHPTAQSLGWGYAFGSALGTVAAIIVVWPHLKKAFTTFSRKLIVPIVNSAWPFAIAGALGLLLTNTDILIISWMRTAADVGIYSAAIRVVQVLYVIPGVMQTSVLPLFSRLANRDDAKLRLALERTISVLFVVAIPIAIGGVLLGTQIISLIFGSAFTEGSLAFKILMVSMLVDFPGSILGVAIFAYSHQKSLIITSAIAGLLNIALDFILIPRFGMTGSAIATLIAQVASNAYLWHIMRKLNYFEILPRLKKVLIASIIMGAATAAFLVLHVEVAINVALCIAIYFLTLRLLKEPLVTEITSIIPAGADVA